MGEGQGRAGKGRWWIPPASLAKKQAGLRSVFEKRFGQRARTLGSLQVKLPFFPADGKTISRANHEFCLTPTCIPASGAGSRGFGASPVALSSHYGEWMGVQKQHLHSVQAFKPTCAAPGQCSSSVFHVTLNLLVPSGGFLAVCKGLVPAPIQSNHSRRRNCMCACGGLVTKPRVLSYTLTHPQNSLSGHAFSTWGTKRGFWTWLLSPPPPPTMVPLWDIAQKCNCSCIPMASHASSSPMSSIALVGDASQLGGHCNMSGLAFCMGLGGAELI